MRRVCYPDAVLQVMGAGIVLMLLRSVSKTTYALGAILSVASLIAVFLIEVDRK